MRGNARAFDGDPVKGSISTLVVLDTVQIIEYGLQGTVPEYGYGMTDNGLLRTDSEDFSTNGKGEKNNAPVLSTKQT